MFVRFCCVVASGCALASLASEIAVSPKESIQAAVDRAKPGDVIRLKPGIYSEQVTVKCRGAAGRPITIEGARGTGGAPGVIVEPPGQTAFAWVPAPEIAANVWKAPVRDRPSIVLMDGAMVALINRFTMALERWEKLPKFPEEYKDWMLQADLLPADKSPSKRLPGLDWLAMADTTRLEGRGSKVWFFPLVGNVLCGWRDGTLYVRMADGEKPADHAFLSTDGNGFCVRKAAHVVFRNLHVRGSRYPFHVEEGSEDITIEKCLLMHGGARVRVGEGAKNTTVRSCVMTCGFIQPDHFRMRTNGGDAASINMYAIFKYLIGTATSDDVGIMFRGDGLEAYDNVIVGGLIGIQSSWRDAHIYRNVVRGMSSVGICTLARTMNARIHDNLIMDCGLPIRIHDLCGSDYGSMITNRSEYWYRNVVVQAPHGGESAVFISFLSPGWDDRGGEKDPAKARAAAWDPPFMRNRFLLYHNTFIGGEDNEWKGAFSPYYLWDRWGRRQMPFIYVNNLAKRHSLDTPAALEVFAGNVLYSPAEEPIPNVPTDKRVSFFNVVLEPQDYARLWNTGADVPAGFVDVSLAKGSPAIGAGVDLSKPFSFAGRDYAPFPGMEKGYFTGDAPAAGALQAGESGEGFTRLFRKSEIAKRLFKGARSYKDCCGKLGLKPEQD